MRPTTKSYKHSWVAKLNAVRWLLKANSWLLSTPDADSASANEFTASVLRARSKIALKELDERIKLDNGTKANTPSK